jgi:hypothetical protein
MTDQVAQVLDYASKVLIFIIFAVLAVNAYLNRNMPRVGGKIGRTGRSTRPRRSRRDFPGSMGVP